MAVGDRIYMLSGTNVIAIDAADGKVLVTYKECPIPFDSVYSDGVVICRNDDSICGFHATSGKLLWKFATREHPEVMTRYGKRRQGHFEPGWRRQLLVTGDARVYFADHKPGKEDETSPRVLGLDIHSGKQAWHADGQHVGQLPHPCFYDDGVLFLTNENGYAGIPTGGKGRQWTIPVRGWKDKGRYRFGAFSGIGISGYLKAGGLVWIKGNQKQRLGEDPYPSQEQKPFKGWIGVVRFPSANVFKRDRPMAG